MLVEFGFIVGVENATSSSYTSTSTTAYGNNCNNGSTTSTSASSNNGDSTGGNSNVEVTPTRRRSLRRQIAVTAATVVISEEGNNNNTSNAVSASSPSPSNSRSGRDLKAASSATANTNTTTANTTPASLSVHSFRFFASPLGRATALSGIAPRDATIVIKHLQQACKRLVLKSGLHCVFLVTPPFASGIEPPWGRLEPLFAYVIREYPDTKGVFELLGVNWAELIRFGRCPPKFGSNLPSSSISNTSTSTSGDGSDRRSNTASSNATAGAISNASERVILYRRLYAAVLLFVLTQEVPLSRVADFVAAPRGQIQQLQKEAAAFCGMATTFCRKLHWDGLASVLEAYSGRLSYGACDEILPLVRLGSSIMPSFRARALYRSGVRSPEDIVNMPVDKLIDLLMASLPFDSAAPIKATAASTSTTAITSSTNSSSTSTSSISSSSKDSSIPNTRIINEDKLHLCSRLAEQIVTRAREALRERAMLQSML